MVWCLAPAGEFSERKGVGVNNFGHGLAIDELPFSQASDKAGLAQDLEMVRDGGGGYATHGDDRAEHAPKRSECRA